MSQTVRWTMPELWIKARERFVADTPEHDMDILHDDELYRHLRFQQAGSSIHYYDLVTWPGHLVICGDAGDYHFARVWDMFEFFEGPRGEISPDYWAQKLQGPRSGSELARRYSFDAYRAHVLDWLGDLTEDDEDKAGAALRAAVDEQLLSELATEDAHHSEDAARALLRDFEHDGVCISDSWEWDLREFEPQYLWCCWAIVWGIGKYRAIERMVG